MTEIIHSAPVLSETEAAVLRVVCRYYMLGKDFNPNRAARYCGLPVWIINYHLKSLTKRKVTRRVGKNVVPLMQASGAPVAMPEITIENGIKIIKCPRMYAEGYAKGRYLP